MSSYQPAKDDVMRFVAGDGAAPPEQVDGPRHFKRLLVSLETGGGTERQSASRELGPDYVSGVFDLDKMNKNLREAFSNGEKK
jgi:hypothetical protein